MTRNQRLQEQNNRRVNEEREQRQEGREEEERQRELKHQRAVGEFRERKQLGGKRADKGKARGREEQHMQHLREKIGIKLQNRMSVMERSSQAQVKRKQEIEKIKALRIHYKTLKQQNFKKIKEFYTKEEWGLI